MTFLLPCRAFLLLTFGVWYFQFVSKIVTFFSAVFICTIDICNCHVWLFYCHVGDFCCLLLVCVVFSVYLKIVTFFCSLHLHIWYLQLPCLTFLLPCQGFLLLTFGVWYFQFISKIALLFYAVFIYTFDLYNFLAVLLLRFRFSVKRP